MAEYHEGELAVQERAGVQKMAGRVKGIIRTVISPGMKKFIQEDSLVIVGSADQHNDVWASILTGDPGFMHVVDDSTLVIDNQIQTDSPLWHQPWADLQVGLLFINMQHRIRFRINGSATIKDGKIEIQTEEVYGNCQKYIQSRSMYPLEQEDHAAATMKVTTVLTPRQTNWLRQADTFFIASAHPTAGADVSHRGGMPGFVRVTGTDRLEYPDYSGNTMFNTLGNITVNPKAGLLFIDFETGDTLQLRGEASIIWDKAQTETFPGAERVIAFQISEIVETDRAIPLRFDFHAYSPFNPT